MRLRIHDTVFTALALVLIAYIGYKTYVLRVSGTNSEHVQELLAVFDRLGRIEGRNLFELVNMDSVSANIIRQSTKSTPIFVVVMTDSSCSPCFGSHIKGFLMSLQTKGYVIDPSQWFCLFLGQNPRFGEGNFRYVFGQKAHFLPARKIHSSLSTGEDSVILYVTKENTVLASSRISQIFEATRDYFINRAIGHLNSK